MSAGPATREERPTAMRIVFGHLTNDEIRERHEQIEAMIAMGELPADGIRIVRDDIGPTAAMIVAPVDRTSAVVWPPRPRVSFSQVDRVLDELMMDATNWLRSRGVRLAQCMLAIEDAVSSRPLLRNGFTNATRLVYYRHFLDLSFAQLTSHEHFDYRSYAEVGEEPFVAVLGRSYEGSLDCPEVNGVRPARDVLTGHRAAGDFDPSRWWLAYDGSEPVGMVLLNAPEPGTWDLAYLGVVPAARRRGLGRELVRKAMFEAKAAERSQLTLALDVRNEPARLLYNAAGFERYDQRDVYLAIL